MLALLLSLISGALCAVLVCKAIHLKLWLDAMAGIGGAFALLAAGHLSGGQDWPLLGWPVGFCAVVVYLKFRRV